MPSSIDAKHIMVIILKKTLLLFFISSSFKMFLQSFKDILPQNLKKQKFLFMTLQKNLNQADFLLCLI